MGFLSKSFFAALCCWAVAFLSRHFGFQSFVRSMTKSSVSNVLQTRHEYQRIKIEDDFSTSVGVSFARWVDLFPSKPDTFFFVQIEPVSACSQFDSHGANDCAFLWGTHVVVNYAVQLGQAIQSHDYLEGHFEVAFFEITHEQ